MVRFAYLDRFFLKIKYWRRYPDETGTRSAWFYSGLCSQCTATPTFCHVNQLHVEQHLTWCRAAPLCSDLMRISLINPSTGLMAFCLRRSKHFPCLLAREKLLLEGLIFFWCAEEQLRYISVSGKSFSECLLRRGDRLEQAVVLHDPVTSNRAPWPHRSTAKASFWHAAGGNELSPSAAQSRAEPGSLLLVMKTQHMCKVINSYHLTWETKWTQAELENISAKKHQTSSNWELSTVLPGSLCTQVCAHSPADGNTALLPA